MPARAIVLIVLILRGITLPVKSNEGAVKRRRNEPGNGAKLCVCALLAALLLIVIRTRLAFLITGSRVIPHLLERVRGWRRKERVRNYASLSFSLRHRHTAGSLIKTMPMQSYFLRADCEPPVN